MEAFDLRVPIFTLDDDKMLIKSFSMSDENIYRLLADETSSRSIRRYG